MRQHLAAASVPRTVVAALAVVVILTLAFARPARAHGADNLAYQGVSGPFLVSVFDGRTTGRPGEAEYRLVLTRDPGDGLLGAGNRAAPVSRADVAVTDADGQTHKANGIGHVYSVVLPDRTQPLRITIAAPPGRTSLDVRVHRLPETSSGGSASSRALLAGAAALLPLCVGVALFWRRRASTDSAVPT